MKLQSDKPMTSQDINRLLEYHKNLKLHQHSIELIIELLQFMKLELF